MQTRVQTRNVPASVALSSDVLLLCIHSFIHVHNDKDRDWLPTLLQSNYSNHYWILPVQIELVTVDQHIMWVTILVAIHR